MKTVLVFGVFDRLHPGHHAFLKEAASLGDRLVVCLAQDSVVMELKKRPPIQPFKEREQALRDLRYVDDVVPGDTALGTYTALKNLHPDVIAFGYDQQALQEDIKKFVEQNEVSVQLITLSPHKPEQYKSSLLPS